MNSYKWKPCLQTFQKNKMLILDKGQLRKLHNLMRDKGVNNVNISMFSEEQRKLVYESYAEQFLGFNGLFFMSNCVVSYALANNLDMVNKKLKQEVEYALKQYDYDYALLCAKLLDDQKIVEFLKQYRITNNYDNIFNNINKFILEIRK